MSGAPVKYEYAAHIYEAMFNCGFSVVSAATGEDAFCGPLAAYGQIHLVCDYTRARIVLLHCRIR